MLGSGHDQVFVVDLQTPDKALESFFCTVRLHTSDVWSTAAGENAYGHHKGIKYLALQSRLPAGSTGTIHILHSKQVP